MARSPVCAPISMKLRRGNFRHPARRAAPRPAFQHHLEDQVDHLVTKVEEVSTVVVDTEHQHHDANRSTSATTSGIAVASVTAMPALTITIDRSRSWSTLRAPQHRHPRQSCRRTAPTRPSTARCRVTRLYWRGARAVEAVREVDRAAGVAVELGERARAGAMTFAAARRSMTHSTTSIAAGRGGFGYSSSRGIPRAPTSGSARLLSQLVLRSSRSS